MFICYFLWILQYIYHLGLHKTWIPKKNNKKYNKNYIRLLGILKTIRGKRDKFLTGKQGQRDLDQKDYYGLWTDEIYSQVLSGTTYYLRLKNT